VYTYFDHAAMYYKGCAVRTLTCHVHSYYSTSRMDGLTIDETEQPEGQSGSDAPKVKRRGRV